MKYALIVRKVLLNENIYYQAIGKIKGNINEYDELEPIEEGNSEFNALPEVLSDNDLSDYAFLEIEKDNFDEVPDNLKNTGLFLTYEDGNLSDIKEVFQKEKVKIAFYNRYHDFDIIPNYNLDEEIDSLRTELNKNVKGQDEIIENILSKIYNNQMFMNSDLSENEIEKYKTNILLMGPHGTGKTLIKDTLTNNMKNIPIIEYSLTGDLQKDINKIIQELIMTADGNVTLAERGIVIFDSMKEKSSNFSDDGENLYLEEIENILESKILRSVETNETLFDYSKVTNIVMFDIDYKNNSNDFTLNNNETYYSKVDFDTLNNIGFDPHIIYDLFNEEIIYMNEMTSDLAYTILKDKNISPLFKIKDVLKKNNKELIFNKNFINRLIEQGLELEEGFQGIIRILNYLTQKKNLKDNIIEFTTKDLDDLKVGSASFKEDYCEYDNDDKQNNNSSKLKVNVKNRTINGLTVMDVVNIITNKIKGQDEQAFRIVNSLYNQVMNRYKNFDREQSRDLKSSVLLIGGTGVGKTAILEKLSTIFNIPYVREDATRFSGTGIVGDDVEDILKDLVEAAHGNRVEAENGIVFLDEFDKLAANAGNRVDIGGDVQRALLTLLEGAKISIRPSQKEFFEPYEFDTTYTIFYVGGAFEGIDKIVNMRIQKEKGGKIGFTNSENKEIIKEITSDDVHEFGIDKQLAGRVPNVIHLNNLDENILFDIINSEEGFVNLSRKSYEFEGVKLNISDNFKRSLAHKSFIDKKGARSIKTIFSKLLDNIDMKRSIEDIEEVILDENSLDNPKQIKYIKRKK